MVMMIIIMTTMTLITQRTFHSSDASGSVTVECGDASEERLGKTGIFFSVGGKRKCLTTVTGSWSWER